MRGISRFPLVLLMFALTAQAAPEPGRYSGILRVTKKVFGISSVTCVRALARVSENGSLEIVLLTPPSPIPLNGAEQKFETMIRADDTCIIPVPVPPSPVFERAKPEYLGKVQVTGSRFSLSYDDVPDRFVDTNGDPVIVTYVMAPIPTAQFNFTFRRVSP